MNQEHLSGIEPDRGSSATLWEGHLVLKARSRRANSIPIPGIGGIITSLDSLMDKIMVHVFYHVCAALPLVADVIFHRRWIGNTRVSTLYYTVSCS